MLSEQDILVKRAIEFAKHYKYWLQYSNPLIETIQPLSKLRYKSFYDANKRILIKLAILENKYKFNGLLFIKYAAYIEKIQEIDMRTKLLDINLINGFITWRQSVIKKQKIYQHYVKSVNNIAKYCIDIGVYSSKEFLRKIIRHRMIADYFVTGKISLYYFAAIPNFKKIIPKLDKFAKEEFQKIGDRFEMYNSEITEAYMLFKNQKVNPIKNTDDIILKMRNDISKTV